MSYRGVDGLIRKRDGFARKKPENECYWLVDCKSKFLKGTFEVRNVAMGEKSRYDSVVCVVEIYSLNLHRPMWSMTFQTGLMFCVACVGLDLKPRHTKMMWCGKH